MSRSAALRSPLLAALLLLFSPVRASRAEASSTASGAGGTAIRAGGWKSLDDLKDGRFAVFTGTIHDGYVQRTYPGATIVRLNSNADFAASVKGGKVDVALSDLTSARVLLKSNPELAILNDTFFDTPLGVGFRKGSTALRDRFNRFLAEIRADGTHGQMSQRWFVEDPEKAVMPEIPLPEGKGMLVVGVAAVDLPYVAVVNGRYAGFDVEMMRRFAAREGTGLELVSMEFSALIAAIASGKVDMISSGISITEERRRLVEFSDPFTDSRSAALVLKSNMAAFAAAGPPTAETKGPFARLAESIRNNLVTERRWILILNGLWVTVLLSTLSTLLGTGLGALVCFMRMSARAPLRAAASLTISFLRGLPALVLLMLIFYVAFASVNVNPLLVGVVAFGIHFAAYVAEIFRSGIEGVDRGQSEAAIAMGFTRTQTFLHFVLPQATRRVLPVYRGEFISLVKNTSIVGFIGVQDLTRAGDIVRSRTFDAFFPLILVAAIYFLVIWVLGLALDHVDRRTDPRLRRKAEGAA